MDNREITRRFDKLSANRKTVEQIWDSIEMFITPYRGRFFKDERDEQTIEWKKRNIYDSTAVMAHQTLAATLHGSITSPSLRWFDIRYRSDEINANKEAMVWLQNASERIFYELQDSNFNLEINETYQDLVGYGTSVITQEARDDTPGASWAGINFSSVPLKDGYFEEDWRGRVLNFYRRIEWTPAQILSKFGETNVPDDIKEQAAVGSDEKITLVFCIFSRSKSSPSAGQRVAPSRRPFGYKYVRHSDGHQFGKEGGYYEMPAFVPRWRKTSSSMWGNSPAMIALADVLTLNEAVELTLKAAEKAIDPPLLAEERSLISDLDLNARALSVVRDINGIKPFESGSRFDVAAFRIEDLRTAIRSYFLTDQINYPSPQGTPMSATEAQIRYELMQRLLGPTLGRLQSDLLNPIIERTLNLLLRAGELGDIPEILQTTQAHMDIEYMGALSRAQRVDQAGAIERWVGGVGGMAQINPDVMLVPEWEQIVRESGRLLNVPETLMRDATAVNKAKKAQQEEMNRAKEAELASMEAAATTEQVTAEQAMQEQTQEGI